MVRGVVSLVLAETNRYDCSRLEATSEGLSLPGLKPARRQPKLYHVKMFTNRFVL